MAEEWRPVVGWKNTHEVSSHGRVRRTKKVRGTTVGKILKQVFDRHGYLYISLCNNTKSKRYSIHRLVGSAFLGKPPSKYVINHKDGSPTNNHVSNLEWVTRSENTRHAIDQLGRQMGQVGAANHKAKLNEKKVLRMRHLAASRTMYQLADEFGVDRSTVYRVLRGRWGALRLPEVVAQAETHPQKLSVKEAQAILELKGRVHPKELAKRFGVSVSNVRTIHRRESWKQFPRQLSRRTNA